MRRSQPVASIVEQIVKFFLPSVLAVEIIQCLGTDHSRLEVVAKIGLFLVFHEIVDALTALFSRKGIIETTPPAAFEIGQTGFAMIQPGWFPLDAGVLPAVPATQSHIFTLSPLKTTYKESLRMSRRRPYRYEAGVVVGLEIELCWSAFTFQSSMVDHHP